MECSFLFDLAVIAENYGQMTGVLAGFAFTALVLLMTPTQAAERAARSSGDGRATLALFSSFIALVLATLIYSVLAGDTDEQARPRAATLEVIDGLVFGLAVISLLQGLYLIMRSANIDASTVKIARFMAVVIFPSMVIYFVAQGASDTVALRAVAGGGACVPHVPVLGVWLTAAAASVLSISLSTRAQRVMAVHSTRSGTVAPILVMGASVAGAIAAGEVSTYSPGFLMSPTVQNLYLTVVAVLVTFVGLMFSAAGATSARERTRPDELASKSDSVMK
ncbi:hypothetical protein [Actinoplanes regularis]|uniref:Uncharacterized protein n=1 Tax=Actinoplanes regularis TaxID=52697 RepID=A0A239EX09_9ACTN|nr:hypothetical protein [Actinoplanes regularis]GIE89743.1 hypothetical protein Are01nite_62230 [Actinoplanes regularis]SNS49117.1 hypothetical protein SAMN06264365_116152 [Actinoplanes regularis]